MKKLSIISYSIVFLVLFIFSLPSPGQAQETCSVTGLSFSEFTGFNTSPLEDNLLRGSETELTVNLSGTGCAENGVGIKVKAEKFLEGRVDVRIDNLPSILKPNASGVLKLELDLEEAGCYGNNNSEGNGWGYKCINTIQVVYQGATIFDSKTGNYSQPSEVAAQSQNYFIERGVVVGNCVNAWCSTGSLTENDNENWKFSELLEGTSGTNAATACTIPAGGIRFTNFNTNLINDGAAPVLTINTTQCKNVDLVLELMEYDSLGESIGSVTDFIDDAIDIFYDDTSVDSIPIITEENQIKLFFQSNSSQCDTFSDPNCRIYVKLSDQQGNLIIETDSGINDENEANWQTDKSFLNEGVIYANCKELTAQEDCLFFNVGDRLDWVLTNHQGFELLSENPSDSNPVFVGLPNDFDENNPCYINEGAGAGTYDINCYELLATLPTGGSSNFFQTNPDTGRQYVLLDQVRIGDYVNQFFKIALGVLMAIAVIMIIIAGVEYMTVESIFGKQVARERIVNAVTGLLIALGIFLILSTINPRLLEVNFAPPQVVIDFESEAGDGFNYNSTPPTGYPSLSSVPTDGSYRPNGCPTGIVLVEGIHICQIMAERLQNLHDAAQSAGYNLTGGGFRTAEQQLFLRQQNCADAQTTPSSQCTPPTARPGRSNHEAGLAVDFKCNNAAMGGACFQWMKNNAPTHGFYNLPSEAWHWSHNGN